MILALTACVRNDPLADRANAGDNNSLVVGDGTVTEYAAADRLPPVQFAATFYDGSILNSDDFLGKVTVLNFWFAACAPCRKEAPDLGALYLEFAGTGVKFYGVNIRDERGTAEAFERNFKLTYPSVADKDGSVMLALTKFVPPTSVPTTLVLDMQGRVSARILGTAEKSTLKALVATALAEA